MLTKIKRIKLGKQIYRRLMKGVLERDQWRWQKCGSLENLQVHHKIKRSQLGNHSLDNLVTLRYWWESGVDEVRRLKPPNGFPTSDRFPLWSMTRPTTAPGVKY